MRLPEQKKALIRSAAMKEFARVPFEQRACTNQESPFEKASINQIIHNAGISRGSFYTYFEDKSDVVQFLMEDMRRELQEFCEREIRRSGGDYFALLDKMFEYFVRTLQKTGGLLHMAKNLFSYQENINGVGFKDWSKPCNMIGEDSPSAWFFNLVDKNKLRVETVEDFSALMPLGTTVILLAIKQYYENPDSLEFVRMVFHKQLDLLKYGALKERHPHEVQ